MPYIDKDKLEQYAEKVFDRLNYFNDYTLRTIGRRIKGIGKLSAHDQQALKNMADISGDMKAITKKLAEITEMNIRDVEKIYTQTVSDGVNSYKPLYDLKGMEFVPFEQNEFAQQLVRHWFSETSGEMVNLSRTKALCFDKYNMCGDVVGSTPLEGAFQKAIDDAVTAVSSGTADFNTAMRETVKNLGGSGVKTDYGNGVTRELSGVIRQNLLYGAKQAALAYDEYIGTELDYNGYEIDFHPFPRKSHEVIQGLIVAKGDNDITVNGVTYPSENKDLGEGKSAAELLNDYGCLHFKTSFMLGVSIPRYDKAWLEEQRANDRKLIEYNGIKKTGFQWKQVQRRIERSVRKLSDIRSMAEASGDNVLVRDCDTKIKAYREKYNDMCKKVGLTPKPERMAVYQGNSVNAVDNSGKSGIIKPINPKIGVQDVHYIGKIDREIYKCVTEDIKTDEVIITNNQIQHIKDRHPNDYERYFKYAGEVLKSPDYILEANKPDTAFILKHITENGKNYEMILRLKTSKDPEEYKNSVITFLKVEEKRYKRYLRTKKILYKSE